MSIRGGAAVLCLALALALLASGCGTAKPAPSDAQARDTVVRFIRLGDSGRFRAACGLLEPRTDHGLSTLEDMHVLALNSLTTEATTYEAVRRDLARKRPIADTCPGAISLVFDVLGSRAAALANHVARLRRLRPFPTPSVVVLGDDEWTLLASRGRWRIATFEGLAAALP